MKTKFTKKGQGALEYLLLIGGAVLIAVIVIALLVGMGSENSTTARKRNAELMESIDTPIPSTISKVTCLDNGNAIVNWTPVYKDDYNFSLSVNGILSQGWDYGSLNSTDNPILAVGGCSDLPAIFIITTKKGDKTAASNSFTVGEEEGLLKVSKPVATPGTGVDTGKYVTGGNFLVTLSSSTPGSKIYYTTNGTEDPTESSTLYSAAINIMPATETGLVTLKSRAYDPTGVFLPSNILTKNFYFVHKPVADKPTGTYATPITVSLVDTKTNTPRSIYYTIDGSDPDTTKTVYGGPISISSTTTLKAITVKSGIVSDPITNTYTISALPTVVTPVANPVGGPFSTPQSIALSIPTTPTPKTIKYTIDGTNPTCNTGLSYGSAISISETTTIKAIGCKSGYTPSAIMTETYTISALPTGTLAYDSASDTIFFTLNPDLDPSKTLFLRFFDKGGAQIAESDPNTTLNEFNNQDSPYTINCDSIKLDLAEIGYIDLINNEQVGDIQIIDKDTEAVLAIIPAESISIGVNNNSFIFHPGDNLITFTLAPDLNPTNDLSLRFLDFEGNKLIESDPSATLAAFNNQNSPYSIVTSDIGLEALAEINYKGLIDESKIGNIQIIDMDTQAVLAIIPAENITSD